MWHLYKKRILLSWETNCFCEISRKILSSVPYVGEHRGGRDSPSYFQGDNQSRIPFSRAPRPAAALTAADEARAAAALFRRTGKINLQTDGRTCWMEEEKERKGRGWESQTSPPPPDSPFFFFHRPPRHRHRRRRRRHHHPFFSSLPPSSSGGSRGYELWSEEGKRGPKKKRNKNRLCSTTCGGDLQKIFKD